MKRMGRSFPWVSCDGSDFNFDYHVSFAPDGIAEGKAYYNYAVRPTDVSDEQGISVFYRNERSEVFHTWSRRGWGLDMVNGACQFLGLAPKAAMRPASNSRCSWYAGTISVEAIGSAAAAELTTSNRSPRRAAGNRARIVTSATLPTNDPARVLPHTIGAAMGSERACFGVWRMLARGRARRRCSLLNATEQIECSTDLKVGGLSRMECVASGVEVTRSVFEAHGANHPCDYRASSLGSDKPPNRSDPTCHNRREPDLPPNR
jgi:hypothetical protein